MSTALVLSALRQQRLADQDCGCVTWANRQYFFCALYRPMEWVLLDHARALLDALAALEQAQPQWAEAIVPRFYSRLTLEDTTRMMDVDERTIRRWWERARSVLAQRIPQLMNVGIPEEQRL